MELKASDLIGRYAIMLTEVRKMIAVLIQQGEPSEALSSAQSKMADLQVNYHLLLLKHQAPLNRFTEEGIDGALQLNAREATLILSINDIYEDTVLAADAAATSEYS